jgi:MFS family permease
MRTYRELFSVPQFRPLFAVACGQTAASTLQGLALSTLVYAATKSPLLSALAMFGSSFAQVIGAATLLSVADRVPPRAALICTGVVFTGGGLLLTAPGLPVYGLLLITLVTGLASSAAGGVQWGLLSEILPDSAYMFGRSVFNMSVGIMQIAGFAAGGVLVAVVSPRGALLAAAALYLASTVTVRLALTARKPRSTGRPSVRETLRVNASLWSLPARRYIYLAAWVPNGLIVGCEALYIPYAPRAAGALFVAAALGMLAGDTVLGRFVPPGRRRGLITPLRLLLPAPYLLFFLRPPVVIAVIGVWAASFGYSASLLLQDRLIAVTPEENRGQALGLNSSGMMTMQAVAATLTGTIAQWLTPATTMTVAAAASVAVTLALTPGLHRQPQLKPRQLKPPTIPRPAPPAAHPPAAHPPAGDDAAPAPYAGDAVRPATSSIYPAAQPPTAR